MTIRPKRSRDPAPRKEVRARKAGLELAHQLSSDVLGVLRKEGWGQLRDVARLIPVEEAAQRHSHMTGRPVHRPPDGALDVAHQVVIRGWLILRVMVGMLLTSPVCEHGSSSQGFQGKGR